MDKELSPAAQSVLDAYANAPWSDLSGDRLAIAAALRAAADQVVPYEATAPWNEIKCDYDGDHWEMRQWVRNKLLAITTELDRSAQ